MRATARHSLSMLTRSLLFFTIATIIGLFPSDATAFQPIQSRKSSFNQRLRRRPSDGSLLLASTNSWWPVPSFDAAKSSFSSFSPKTTTATSTATSTHTGSKLLQAKMDLLQIGAAMDRGQSYNPTSGDYYSDRMEMAKSMIEQFVQDHPNQLPSSMQDIKGEWELIFSTVPHGIFRSSPFFLAIQEAYEVYAKQKQSFGMSKADLFFKLHELQTCSWGVSKIGRVAQTITDDYLYSEFDTSIFSLTVIPILGWFKLLPTFGGCVVTAAKASLERSTTNENGAVLNMVVDYTTARKVPGLSGLGAWIWNVRVPVGAIWKLLPWNKGRDATCKVWVRYCDEDFRIVQDISGDYFVYARPVLPRPLDLAQQ